MASERMDYLETERLKANEVMNRTAYTVAVQSATIPDGSASVIVYDVGSSDKVQFLPGEVSNADKQFEFFVLDTSSANLVIKNASGDTKAIVPPGGYAKVVSVKGVWRAGPGNVFSTFSQLALTSFNPGWTSAASAVGFSSVTEANQFRDLVLQMARVMAARGWITFS